ncbi:MAG TPA: hypothetical protein VKU01_02975 [Bryobacteraceae bacterium]|nr:hypothetical protein [Bryobacteraceae bacterium]
MENEFTTLEKNILRAKGLADSQVAALAEAGIASKQDLLTVGDATTLAELVPGIDPAVAARVMDWATGRVQAQAQAAAVVGGSMLLDSADLVYCVHCGAKQPKDYKSGDLCIACGKQAEPILSCYWCSASGPGKFCRTCGAEFVPTAELDLAVLLRHEGLAKDEIPTRLRTMTIQAKDDLWGRVRRMRS